MRTSRDAVELFLRRQHQYLPHLSVDCVVFGFHDGRLKILLLKWKGLDVRALPGGYVGRRETIDAAAARVLAERTGLARTFLRQFHAFGGVDRHESDLRRWFRAVGVAPPRQAWTFARVVSIGYYALVDAARVEPAPDFVSERCDWYDVPRRPRLAFDHDEIVATALAALRHDLGAGALEAPLLPERFTMPELQRLHEAILGRRLDRRNFQKRMLERGVLKRLALRRTGAAHRSPFLYRFVSGRLVPGSRQMTRPASLP